MTLCKTLMDDAGTPMCLMMYAAAGIPTVCTDLQEVRRMGLPNVVLVEDEAQALALGIARALDLPRARPSHMGTYDLPQLLKRYESVLEGSV